MGTIQEQTVPNDPNLTRLIIRKNTKLKMNKYSIVSNRYVRLQNRIGFTI